VTLPAVVGIDTSLTGTGLAWPDGRCVEYGRSGLTVTTDKKTGEAIPAGRRGQLMLDLARELGGLILGQPVRPEWAFIEGLELHSRSSGGLSERCWLWWSMVNLLTAKGVQVVEVAPTKLKLYATGKGQCKKELMIDGLARRLPQFETSGNDNRVDAAWLVAFGCDLLGSPLVDLPVAHRKALTSVKLPETVR
jgi:hypothetical protein